MNYQSLLSDADIRPCSEVEMVLDAISRDGHSLLKRLIDRYRLESAACIRRSHFDASVQLSSYPDASSVWYSDKGIKFLVWDGDLVVDGDLIDDDFSGEIVLVVNGNLEIRNWLRGGMPGFVNGSVRACGYVVGHYNDSALFVGGDLAAAGYIPRAKPYADLPRMAPHQISGKIHAQQFDASDASNEDLQSTFASAVLVEEDGDIFLNEKAVIEQENAGLPIWRP